MRESERMERDRGDVDDFHKESKYFDAQSTINIDEQIDEEKYTNDGKENWG